MHKNCGYTLQVTNFFHYCFFFISINLLWRRRRRTPYSTHTLKCFNFG